MGKNYFQDKLDAYVEKLIRANAAAKRAKQAQELVHMNKREVSTLDRILGRHHDIKSTPVHTYGNANVTIPDFLKRKPKKPSLFERFSKMGRGGDTEMVLVPRSFAELLDHIIHHGRKQLNPQTGLREYMPPKKKEEELRKAAQQHSQPLTNFFKPKEITQSPVQQQAENLKRKNSASQERHKNEVLEKRVQKQDAHQSDEGDIPGGLINQTQSPVMQQQQPLPTQNLQKLPIQQQQAQQAPFQQQVQQTYIPQQQQFKPVIQKRGNLDFDDYRKDLSNKFYKDLENHNGWPNFGAVQIFDNEKKSLTTPYAAGAGQNANNYDQNNLYDFTDGKDHIGEAFRHSERRGFAKAVDEWIQKMREQNRIQKEEAPHSSNNLRRLQSPLHKDDPMLNNLKQNRKQSYTNLLKDEDKILQKLSYANPLYEGKSYAQTIRDKMNELGHYPVFLSELKPCTKVNNRENYPLSCNNWYNNHVKTTTSSYLNDASTWNKRNNR